MYIGPNQNGRLFLRCPSGGIWRLLCGDWLIERKRQGGESHWIHTDAPKTENHDSGIMLLFLAVGAVVCGIIAFKCRKRAGKLFWLMICFVLIGTSGSLHTFAEEAGSDAAAMVPRSFSVSAAFNMNETAYTANAEISYDF